MKDVGFFCIFGRSQTLNPPSPKTPRSPVKTLNQAPQPCSPESKVKSLNPNSPKDPVLRSQITLRLAPEVADGEDNTCAILQAEAASEGG